MEPREVYTKKCDECGYDAIDYVIADNNILCEDCQEELFEMAEEQKANEYIHE